MIHNILYLHGFASSPGARKAALMRQFLADYAGVNFVVPDLNVPDFEHLTLTAQIDTIAAVIGDLPEGPVYPVGSSLGGLALAHFMDRRRASEAQRVTRMALLAPALEMVRRWSQDEGTEAMQHWQETGSLEVFHYGYEQTRRLHYGFFEDVQRYDDDRLSLDVPVLVIHGRQDESVDYQVSVRFIGRQSNATLHLMDTDHHMIEQMPAILQLMSTFFGL
jgi:uncharacterized protein